MKFIFVPRPKRPKGDVCAKGNKSFLTGPCMHFGAVCCCVAACWVICSVHALNGPNGPRLLDLSKLTNVPRASFSLARILSVSVCVCTNGIIGWNIHQGEGSMGDQRARA